jgi:cytidyltransferase-like protein
MRKKVLVAGFFDLLHSGHISFLEEAAELGDVYVSLGSDKNSVAMKNKTPVCSEDERKYILESIRWIKEVKISSGETGSSSYVPYLDQIRPDIFFTNEDASGISDKIKICSDRGIQFVQSKRRPPNHFQARSSSVLSEMDTIPLRLDLVGFYDQIFINSIMMGSVVLANISPFSVDDRSGMSSSTRKVIHKVFGNRLPRHLSAADIAKIIFAVENPPGHRYVSGAVDQLGICLPGINRLHFDNNHWPCEIETISDNATYKWLQNYLFLKQTKPRPDDYTVFTGNEAYTSELVANQSSLGNDCWDSIKSKDVARLGRVINEVHENQKNMIPGYESQYAANIIEEIKERHLGVKLMGAGGYGYMMIVTETPDPDFLPVSIRVGE